MANKAQKPENVTIIGSGLAGLSLAHWLATIEPEAAPKVSVLEAGPRTGGLIWTHSQDGYMVESGPQGWMGEAPGLTRLVTDLGLDEQLIKIKLTDHPRLIARKGRLHPIPQSPFKVALSGLASPGAKFRLLKEFRIPAVKEQGLSVAQWASRRFGTGLLDVFDAMATGFYAGDISRISVDHTFPTLRGLEGREGSLLRFAMKNRSQLTKSRLVVPEAGMGDIMERLARGLADKGVAIETGQTVKAVAPEGDGFVVTASDGEHTADSVVMAVGPNQAQSMLPRPDRTGWPERSSAPIAVVGLGFPEEAFNPPLRGFGCLIPYSEGAFGLGTLYPSAILPGRAPGGSHLLQTLVGGIRHPDRVELSDEEMLDGCLKDLGRYLRFVGGKAPEPSFTHIIRHRVGIPQLELGHEALVTRRAELERQYPGLHFTGMGYESVAVAAIADKTLALAQRMLGSNGQDNTNQEGKSGSGGSSQ